jgi:hypothetical protein
MTVHKFLFFTALILTACSQGSHKTSLSGTSQKDSSHLSDTALFIQNLSKKNLTKNNNYYKLTQISDSTFMMTWGNDSITRTYEKPIDFFTADRLEISWDNKDYLILDYNIGSGVWKTIVLPINNKQQVQIVDNDIGFDSKNNLLGALKSDDTLLVVQNLQTLQEQFIFEKENGCFNHFYCIDSISITNKTLYYKWNPNNNKNLVRKIHLKI